MDEKNEKLSKLKLIYLEYLREKEDMGVDFFGADDIALEVSGGITFLKSCYEVISHDPTNKQKRKEIDAIHAVHGEQIIGLFDRFNKSAVRTSLHSLKNQGRGELALDASFLVEKAIERNDAKSAAYLMFMYTCQILALGEDIYQPYITDYIAEQRISTNARKNRKGSTNKKKAALLLGLTRLSELYGSVPTENELITYLRKYPNEDSCLDTEMQECSSIWFQDARIWFKWCSDISKEERIDSISTSTYKTDYKKLINL